jgi:uncharacterized protein YggE
MKLLLLALAAAVVVAAVSFAGSAHGDLPSPGTVTTTGHGSVTLVPDKATISAGVHTQSKTAAAALAQNAAAMNDVIDALKAHGGGDLQTEQVSLQPQTSPSGEVTGYAADDSVSASSPIAGAGALIDAAVAAGANTVSGPDLQVSDQDAAYRKALAAAVADARAKAQALGGAGGFSVGPISSVSEESDTPQPVFQAAVAKSAGTPVEAGTQDVTAGVTVTFRIQ